MSVAGQRRYFQCLNFDINRSPSWGNSVSLDEMIGYVVSRINDWKNNRISESDLNEPQLFDEFIFQMCYQEGQGVQTREEVQRLRQQDENSDTNIALGKTAPERETLGMLRGLRLVRKRYKEMEKQEPCITVDLLCEFHKVLMQHDSRIAGQISKSIRCTVCLLKRVKLYYPEPEIVEEVFPILCDSINIMTTELFNAAKSKLDESLLTEIIRFFAWSFISLLSLHPFGDGNGRWARLVLHFLHHILSPLPVPIYNVFSPSNRNDYIMALCRDRAENQVFSYNTKPSDLAAMILNCEYHTWKEYDRILSEKPLYNRLHSLSGTDSESRSQSQSPE